MTKTKESCMMRVEISAIAMKAKILQIGKNLVHPPIRGNIEATTKKLDTGPKLQNSKNYTKSLTSSLKAR